jgi:hypothetical protein
VKIYLIERIGNGLCFVIEETCKSYECLKFNFATEPDKRAELWKARHNAWYAAQALKPGSKVRMYSKTYLNCNHVQRLSIFL